MKKNKILGCLFILLSVLFLCGLVMVIATGEAVSDLGIISDVLITGLLAIICFLRGKKEF